MSYFFCQFIGMGYPLYASFKAIESAEKDDDTQWLMYWVCFAAFSLLETFSDYIIFWIPFYWELKLIFLIVLQLPKFKVAEKIYYLAVQPYMRKYSTHIDKFVDEVSKEGVGKIISTAQEMIGNIQKSAQSVPTKAATPHESSFPSASDESSPPSNESKKKNE